MVPHLSFRSASLASLIAGCSSSVSFNSTHDGPCRRAADGGLTALVRAADGNEFCVDATEVSVGRYARWLEENANEVQESPWEGACPSRSPRAPVSSWPPTSSEEDLPVTGVGWCDAAMYCQARGDRLCGSTTGERREITEFHDVDGRPDLKSAWYVACTDSGRLPYGYGFDPKDGVCLSGEEVKQSGVEAVGSRETCAGGTGGTFDLPGNAYEWTDECGDFLTEVSDELEGRYRCVLRGDPEGCSGSLEDLSSRAAWIGFRCCSKVTR